MMPQFNERTLSNRDLNDIIRYVNVLQTRPANTGGIASEGLGPVAEGLIAWVFGMGALLVVVRLIGSDA
ncbi:MAG: hypothetical protein GIW95_06135 [Candidatus Eremiobacteraeota bacterium]|nr:hypothetical protein [Candidatus Eremiobacteraeota bacterium]